MDYPIIVPEWWYLIIFGAMFALGIISIEVWPSQMPVWAFVLALVIGQCFRRAVGPVLMSLSLHLRDPYWHDSSNHQFASRIEVSQNTLVEVHLPNNGDPVSLPSLSLVMLFPENLSP